jgi:hypothetical protein
MTEHNATEQGLRPEDGDEQESKALWGHSLAAAAVCIGTGAAIALLGIFG